LQWDLNYLLKLWSAIDGAGREGKGAFLIYQESSLVIRAIRDYFNSDIGEILIDTETLRPGAAVHGARDAGQRQQGQALPRRRPLFRASRSNTRSSRRFRARSTCRRAARS
jgi:RNAse E (EC 3.1.4.-)